METKTIDIRHCTDWDELHCRYPRQTTQQGCYIELDCRSGVLRAAYNAEIGNAVPFSVYYGHDRRYGIPCLTADAANELLDEIAPLAQRVLDGYDSHWDGNNHVAVLSDDASAAEEEIEEIIASLTVDESNGISEYEAGDWLDGWDRDGLTATATEEELDRMAQDLEEDAAGNNVVLIGCRGHLEFLRQKMRDELNA